MKVSKSYGTDGSVVINLSSEDPADFDVQEPVFIPFDGLPVPFFFEKIDRRGGRIIAKFEDVDSSEDAEELVGKSLSLDEECQNETDDEPFVGMVLYDQHNNRIGTVTEFNNWSGNTCITVDRGSDEVIVPINENLILKVGNERLKLTVPDGLL